MRYSPSRKRRQRNGNNAVLATLRRGVATRREDTRMAATYDAGVPRASMFAYPSMPPLPLGGPPPEVLVSPEHMAWPQLISLLYSTFSAQLERRCVLETT